MFFRGKLMRNRLFQHATLAVYKPGWQVKGHSLLKKKAFRTSSDRPFAGS